MKNDQIPVLAVLFVIRCDLCQLFCQLQPGVHTGGLCVPGHHLICVDDILGVGNAHKHIVIGCIRKIAVRHLRQRLSVAPCHLAPLGPSLCGVELRGTIFTGIIACIQTLVLGRIQLFPRILIFDIGIRIAGIIDASITRNRHPVFAACRGRRDGIQHLLHGVKNIRPFLSIECGVALGVHKGGLLDQEDDVAGRDRAGLVGGVGQICFDLGGDLSGFRPIVIQLMLYG